MESFHWETDLLIQLPAPSYCSSNGREVPQGGGLVLVGIVLRLDKMEVGGKMRQND